MCINELLSGQHDEITVSVLMLSATYTILFLIFIPIIDLNPCSIIYLVPSYTVGLTYPFWLIIIHLVSLF